MPLHIETTPRADEAVHRTEPSVLRDQELRPAQRIAEGRTATGRGGEANRHSPGRKGGGLVPDRSTASPPRLPFAVAGLKQFGQPAVGQELLERRREKSEGLGLSPKAGLSLR